MNRTTPMEERRSPSRARDAADTLAERRSPTVSAQRPQARDADDRPRPIEASDAGTDAGRQAAPAQHPGVPSSEHAGASGGAASPRTGSRPGPRSVDRTRVPLHGARPAADEERRHADEAMRLAIDAFDCGTALVDLAHGRLHWCSPGFSSHCCVFVDDPLDRLESQVPGLTRALSRLARQSQGPAPVQTWPLPAAGLQLQATLVRPGLAALRLLGEASRADAAPRAPDSAQDRERAARRHLEDREKLLFTSRALSVGEMASTLAHELNQPIGTVANVLRGLRLRIERGEADGHGRTDRPEGADKRPQLLTGVQLALDQALFASRIIARIREYTQSREPRRERLELGTVVRESLALLDWELQRDSVAVTLALTDQPCPVLGDEVMLQQLFVNLLRNAIEAMRDNPPDARGRIRRTLAVTLQHERQGREAVLTLSDNGCGLPSDAQQQLFVPFQSTKPNGMGIGLNICRSFAELHQGRLWFSPNGEATQADARGCRFHVALPLQPAAAADATPAQPQPTLAPKETP